MCMRHPHNSLDNHVYSNELILKIRGVVMRAYLVVLNGAGLQGKGVIMRNASEVEDRCDKGHRLVPSE